MSKSGLFDDQLTTKKYNLLPAKEGVFIADVSAQDIIRFGENNN